MCGPPDFAALGTCIIRLAELSAAGLATYSVCKTASLGRELRPKREELAEDTPRKGSDRLAPECSSGHSNA
jgi:hypothetical protein